MKNIAFIFIFLFATLSLNAQDSWQRKYPSVLNDTTVLQIAGETSRTGRSLVVSVGQSADGARETMYLTLLDVYGTELWTVEVYSDELEGDNFIDAHIYDNESVNDGYFFNFTTQSDEGYHKYLGKISRNGLEGDIVTLNIADEDTDLAPTYFFTSSIGRNIVVFNEESGIGVTRLENHNEVLWNSLFTNEDYGLEATHIAENADSTLLVSGVYDGEQPFFMTVDSSGQVLNGKQYVLDSNSVNYTKTLRWEDKSGYVMLATQPGHSRFIALDSVGDVLWSKYTNPDNPIEQVDFTLRDNRIIVVGQRVDNDTLRHLSFDIDRNGAVNNATTYRNDAVAGSFLGVYLTEGGYNLMGNNMLNDDIVPIIYAHDGDNSAFCSELITMDTLWTANTTSDTLTFDKAGNIASIDTTDYMVRPKSLWNVPKLNVTADPERFCPDETVMSDIEASVSVAPESTVSYKWNTGDTTTMIVGTEIDEPYVVTSTINYQECFELIDTTILKRYEVPMPAVNLVWITNCEYQLIGVPQSGKPPFQYAWSTGESGETITVEEEGTYSLTVTDDCGSEGSVDVDVIFPELKVDIVEIADNEGCTNFGLIAQVSNAQGVPTISWNNGSTDISIDNLSSGTYSVTVLDDCGMSATDSYNLTAHEPITDYSLTEDLDCEDDRVVVEVDELVGGNASLLEFSLLSNPSGTGGDRYEGPVQDLIFNLEDFCGNSFIDTLDYERQCSSCLKYPVAFFPQGQEDVERTFGPVDICDTPEEFTDYEFKVFNRWGQEVFSTTTFGDEWNGFFNDEAAPQEVYTYYARYTLRFTGEEKVDKGNVTLIR